MSTPPDINQLVEPAVVALLQGRVGAFRYDLKVFAVDAGISNTPRRRFFELVNDVLSFPEVVAKIGHWCLSEIECTSVQFNPVVPL